jgi:trehalose 6-phosphate phosphatase
MSGRPSAAGALAADPARARLICDFDGVLAPIVADPTASAMPPAVAITLGALARRFALVAVLSGRPLDFLRERVPVPGVQLLGSYGMERYRDGQPYVAPAARIWLQPVREASARLAEHFAHWPGVRVEDKAVSVAVHWRQAADPDAAANQVRRVTSSIAAATGLRAEPGKLVEELRPPIDTDKGSTVAELLSSGKPGPAAYAGDDLGDLPALEVIRTAGGYALVVDHREETDPRLLEVADQVFPGTDAFARWLSDLAEAAGA